jgi:hypothetical protein
MERVTVGNVTFFHFNCRKGVALEAFNASLFDDADLACRYCNAAVLALMLTMCVINALKGRF